MNAQPTSPWSTLPVGRMHVFTFFLGGEWGRSALTGLRLQIERLVHSGCRGVVLDLSRVLHLDYRGVQQLASAASASRRAGGDLKLVGLSPYLQLILQAAGAHGVFENYTDPDSARDAFARILVPTVH